MHDLENIVSKQNINFIKQQNKVPC